MKINKVLLENIFSLFTIRGLEYMLGLITFPYLVRVLQPEYYGTIAFAQSMTTYFVLLDDYGFNLTGPQSIAASPKERHAKIFMSIFYAKLILFLISSLIFIVLLHVVPWMLREKSLYLAVYSSVVGNVLFPVWFFQGIQKMRYITLVNILARSVTTISVFMFVSEEKDYITAAFLQSIPPFLAGCFSFVILWKNYRYLFATVSWKEVQTQFIEGWQIFFSTISINLYTGSNTFFLGLLTNPTVVGYFSSVRKMIACLQGLLGPISQAIYPYISSMAARSREDAVRFVKKCIYILCGGNFLLSFLLFIFAEPMVYFLFGESFMQGVSTLRILAFLPFIISLSNLWGIQTMIPFGWKRSFSRIVFYAMILNTCMVFPLIYFMQADGVALSMLITECFVSFMCWYELKKRGISFFGRETKGL